MNYEQKYKESLDRAKKLMETCDSIAVRGWCEHIFPELYELEYDKIRKEDERVRKELIDAVKGLWEDNKLPMPLFASRADAWMAWLQKQGKTTIWDKKDEQILNAAILHIKNKTYNYCGGYTSEYVIQWIESLKNRYIWTPIEKQGEQIDIANKEYWRGYREGKKEILDKYAELEKQDKQNTNILWHDVSEEPEMYRELLCEWYAKGDINHITSFHDVAFYHTNSKTFWNGEQQIYNVIKWAYVDEIL